MCKIIFAKMTVVRINVLGAIVYSSLYQDKMAFFVSFYWAAVIGREHLLKAIVVAVRRCIIAAIRGCVELIVP